MIEIQIHGIFVVCGNRVASTDSEIFPCGYISCDLPEKSIEWIKTWDGQKEILNYVRQTHDGELVNNFLKAKGNIL